MRWTNWRKIADKDYWYTESLDWGGPACYELAIAGPRGGSRKTVYVGETNSEKRRMSTYAKNGSHLSELINAHLEAGWHLYYHAILTETKEKAVLLFDNLGSNF